MGGGGGAGAEKSYEVALGSKFTGWYFHRTE
jgi:hypothetical protein